MSWGGGSLLLTLLFGGGGGASNFLGRHLDGRRWLSGWIDGSEAKDMVRVNGRPVIESREEEKQDGWVMGCPRCARRAGDTQMFIPHM